MLSFALGLVFAGPEVCSSMSLHQGIRQHLKGPIPAADPSPSEPCAGARFAQNQTPPAVVSTGGKPVQSKKREPVEERHRSPRDYARTLTRTLHTPRRPEATGWNGK